MYQKRAKRLKTIKATEKKQALINNYKTLRLFLSAWMLFSFQICII